jgi:AbiV family abortive infection protein
MDLYGESKMLFHQGHNSRAYTLATACTEELTKAMICKNILAGVADPSELVSTEKGKPRNVLRDHKAKPILFELLPFLRQEYLDNPDQIKQLLTNPKKTLDSDEVNLTKAREISHLFKTMEYDRQNSLYIGLVDKTNEILVPSKQIDVKKIETLFASIDLVLPIVEE